MSTIQPYFRRRSRAPGWTSKDFGAHGDVIDLRLVSLDDYEAGDAVKKAQSLFDARAAACVSAGVAVDGFELEPGGTGPVRVWPAVAWTPSEPRGPNTSAWYRDLLEVKSYDDDAGPLRVLTTKCLPAMAYLDFFPEHQQLGSGLRTLVSAAVLSASPGFCGSFGPGINGAYDVAFNHSEGNYDMTQMSLLPLIYQYYPELSGQAREYAITKLLARGRINRANVDDTFTSGRPPVDWERAGYISPGGVHTDMGETENHIIMIATARYLTNQLLYQRDHSEDFDNRRNANTDGWTCLSVLLTLLRDYLRDDFSEYNAKPYQAETRRALLCLHAYAYDHEVRLAARMVLDYISARVATSTNDLRRMAPFRRRNEDPYTTHDPAGFMTLGLLGGDPDKGADPMAACFALQAANTRAYASTAGDVQLHDSGSDLSMEVLSEYRIPDSIHDLFVNDQHRQFFQKLHRTFRNDEFGGNHNADNMEIYAASPSYLITAGGGTSSYAIDPSFAGMNVAEKATRQELGVSVTTSFMPTGHSGTAGPVDDAAALIQFSLFAEGPSPFFANSPSTSLEGITRNYGVAPDFACGHNLHLPLWVVGTSVQSEAGSFLFVDYGPGTSGSTSPGAVPIPRRADRPGFYLAIYRQGPLALLEAFDTWLNPGVSFEAFTASVLAKNRSVQLLDNEEFAYTTNNGNRIRAVIWTQPQRKSAFGAEIVQLTYATDDPASGVNHAAKDTDGFLTGTIMNSPSDAVVDITNPFMGTTISLDMKEMWRPRRTAENGDVDEAGPHREVWLDFDWTGPSEGDVCRPFATVAAATDAVASGGSIRILPGTSRSRTTITAKRPLRFVAPMGGVVLGGQVNARRDPADAPSDDPLTRSDLWLQFDYPASSAAHLSGPLRTLRAALNAVPDGGIVRLVPGEGIERLRIGNGRRFTLRAPIGKVRLGARDWYGLYDEWRDIGGLSSPGAGVAAVARTPDNLDVVTLDLSGVAFASRWSTGGDWLPDWLPAGGNFPAGARVSAVSRTPDHLDVFCTDANGQVHTAAWSADRDWTNTPTWRSLGGAGWADSTTPSLGGTGFAPGFAPGATVTAISRTPERVDLFAVDGGGRVCTSSWSAGTDWTGDWPAIAESFTPHAVVSVVARTPDHVDLFVVGLDGAVHTSSWSAGGNWSGEVSIGGRFPTGSVVTVVSRTPLDLDLFATGADGRVQGASWSGQAGWTGWQSLGGFFPAESAIAAVSRRPDHLDLFTLGGDGRAYTSNWSLGGTWSGAKDNWRSVGGFFPAWAEVSAVARTPEHLDLFIAGGDGHVYTNWWPASR